MERWWDHLMIINPCAPRLNPAVLEQLRQVEPATVGHFLPSGCMTREFRTSVEDARVIGHAVTLRLPSIDSTLCHKIVEIAKPGDVIVVDRCGDMIHACWGAAMTYTASLRGIAGAVIDGSVTDILDIRRMGFPVFYQRLSALTTRILGLEGEINVPIQCGGTVVHPGDLVIADINGVCIIPPGSAEDIVAHAVSEQEKEKLQFMDMERGVTLASLSGADGKIPPEVFRKNI